MRPRWGSGGLVAIVLACGAPPASAQPAPAAGGRVEVAGAAVWVSSTSLGGGGASLTPNAGRPSFVLFTTSGELAASVGGDFRIGYRVSRALTLSLAGGVSRAAVRVRISGDVEGAPDTSFTGDTLLQWTVGGRADYDLRRLRFASGRARPFVLAGAGLLRQSHEGRVSIERGQVYEGGAGLGYTCRERPGSRLSRISLVVELRVAHVRGGFNWGRGARTSPAFGGGVATTWGRLRKGGIIGH